MTPEQALTVLDAMAARAPGSRADHDAAKAAVAVLAEEIAPDDDDRPPLTAAA